MIFAGYSGFPHQLQLASHDLCQYGRKGDEKIQILTTRVRIRLGTCEDVSIDLRLGSGFYIVETVAKKEITELSQLISKGIGML